MLTCINVKFMFRFVQLRKYSPNGRCRPPSCLLAVFVIVLRLNRVLSDLSQLKGSFASIVFI